MLCTFLTAVQLARRSAVGPAHLSAVGPQWRMAALDNQSQNCHWSNTYYLEWTAAYPRHYNWCVQLLDMTWSQDESHLLAILLQASSLSKAVYRVLQANKQADEHNRPVYRQCHCHFLQTACFLLQLIGWIFEATEQTHEHSHVQFSQMVYICSAVIIYELFILIMLARFTRFLEPLHWHGYSYRNWFFIYLLWHGGESQALQCHQDGVSERS